MRLTRSVRLVPTIATSYDIAMTFPCPKYAHKLTSLLLHHSSGHFLLCTGKPPQHSRPPLRRSQSKEYYPLKHTKPEPFSQEPAVVQLICYSLTWIEAAWFSTNQNASVTSHISSLKLLHLKLTTLLFPPSTSILFPMTTKGKLSGSEGLACNVKEKRRKINFESGLFQNYKLNRGMTIVQEGECDSNFYDNK